MGEIILTEQTPNKHINLRIGKSVIQKNTKSNNYCKYPTLNFISIIYKVLAMIIIIACIGAILLNNLDNSFEILIGGVLSGITIFAFSEVIQVLIQIEENTRNK